PGPAVQRDMHNLITQSTDARGDITHYSYDTRGNVTSVLDAIDTAGHSLSFNGTSDFVQTATTNSLNTLPLTIEAWVKPALRNDGTSFPDNAVSSDNPTHFGAGFGVNVFPGGSQLTVEYFNGFRYVPGVSFAADTWYHIAVVYTEGEVKTYVNGT